MGTSAKTLSRLVSLHRSGALKDRASMIEFGAQQLFCPGQEAYVREVIRYFASQNSDIKAECDYSDIEIRQMADGGLLGRLMNACGFEYRALDIFDAEQTTLFDLNFHEAGPELREKYDLVTNFGTTEHILNQYQGMKTAHELAKPGGLIYHDLPLTGYHNHGYFSYNPLLFVHLALANQYRIIFQHYSMGAARTQAPDFMTANGYPEADYVDCGIEFIFQKTASAAFRMPLETGTSLGLNGSMWGEKNPYSDGVVSLSGDRSIYRVLLEQVSGWDLQRALMRRYRQKLARFFGAR